MASAHAGRLGPLITSRGLALTVLLSWIFLPNLVSFCALGLVGLWVVVRICRYRLGLWLFRRRCGLHVTVRPNGVSSFSLLSLCPCAGVEWLVSSTSHLCGAGLFGLVFSSLWGVLLGFPRLVDPSVRLSWGHFGGPSAVCHPSSGRSHFKKYTHTRAPRLTSPDRRAALRNVLPDQTKAEVELLGSCSMVSRRSLAEKERSRVHGCKTCLILLACIRLPFERYLRVCRTFAVSKVAYGWIARGPTLTVSQSLWSRIHVLSHRIRAASPWLRAALFGGGLHLDIIFGSQLVGLLSRVQRHRPLTWHTTMGSPSKVLSSWLVCRGWRLIRPWVWSHDLTGQFLDLTVAGNTAHRQHVVREAWRGWCLIRHISSMRRDADLDCFRCGYFSRIDWKETRRWAASCPEARSLATGASISPAALAGGDDTSEDRCVWPGCLMQGAWDLRSHRVVLPSPSCWAGYSSQTWWVFALSVWLVCEWLCEFAGTDLACDCSEEDLVFTSRFGLMAWVPSPFFHFAPVLVWSGWFHRLLTFAVRVFSVWFFFALGCFVGFPPAGWSLSEVKLGSLRWPLRCVPSIFGVVTLLKVHTRSKVTAVFCQSAIDSAQNDHTTMMHAILANLGKLV